MTHDNLLDEHILNIIQTQQIREQSELQDYLKERSLDIPQATLSRRLKKLKIAKVAGFYKALDFKMMNLPVILNIQSSTQGLIVLHTHPGNANSIAFLIDRNYVSYNPNEAQSSGIMGTIAGDDTILLILKDPKDSEKVIQMLCEQFLYLNKI